MKAIIAVNKLGYIGLNGALPWRCSSDLAHFQKMTIDIGSGYLMVGRVTAEKLPSLPNRILVIVGSGPDCNSFEDALKMNPDWLIGGKKLYEAALPYCDELHLSIINDYTVGDTMCPDLNLFKGNKIEVYNFEPNVPKPKVEKEFSLAKALEELNKSMEERIIEEKLKQANNWVEQLNAFKKFPKLDIVCRHDIFEQQLIKNGLTREQAQKHLRMLHCPCPKCSSTFF